MAAVGISGYQAVDLNYTHYDDETYPYVFVHSTREMLTMIDEVEARSERLGTGLDTEIAIMSDIYWPLPWYFRDYPKAIFWQAVTDTEVPMIIANAEQATELAPKVEGRYTKLSTYTLRPGVELDLYVRSDVAAN
jgi:predicted membrane-bound mannosyltransferase